MAETRRFANLSTRSQLKVANQLGVILRKDGAMAFRRPDLDLFDAYYEGRQYDGKAEWDQSEAIDGSYVPIKDRRPPLQFNFAKVLASRVASKLVGGRAFPKFKVEMDEQTEEYLRLVIQSSRLKSKILEPIRRMIAAGSVFVRFSIVEGQWKVEHYLSKWCFPVMDAAGNIDSMEIKYVFDDHEDLDEKKQPKKKWFKMTLGKMKDVLYDNPEWNKSEKEPEFKVVATADHELGFVQGEWFKTADLNNNDFDGPSMIKDILPFIDELNYSMSQSATAIRYNQDPQLLLKNMDEDEMETMIRSAMKAWNLGREGDASFLEAGMGGVEAAGDFRDMVRLGIQDLARVVLLDPEKMVSHAQSGKAMEVLHGPMVELIEEMRPGIEKSLTNLVLKMAMTNLIQDSRGAPVPIQIPPGYRPKNLNIVVAWSPVFPPTMEDLQKKVSVASQAASANLISRETLTKWLAKDFDIEDVEAEVERVNTQPVINPFGGF